MYYLAMFIYFNFNILILVFLFVGSGKTCMFRMIFGSYNKSIQIIDFLLVFIDISVYINDTGS